MLSLLVGAAVIVPVAWLAVGRVRRWALRRAILDIPNDRSSHTEPTPRGGGVVFFPILALFLIVAALTTAGIDGARIGWFLLWAGIVAGVSWLDDVRSLPSSLRLLVHSAAAAGVLVTLGAWDVVAIPGLGQIGLGAAGAVLAFLWIGGLTNAYNFMDGIDGIAAAQALTAGCGWAVLGWMGGWPAAAAAGAGIAALAAGFLVHNWPPARIFMGDVGSAFLGFTFAALPFLADPRDPRLPLAAALLVWPFMLDAAFTFFRRLLAGENVLQAHRSHLYQRLVGAGWSHARVSLLYGALAAAGAILAILWWRAGAPVPLQGHGVLG